MTAVGLPPNSGITFGHAQGHQFRASSANLPSHFGIGMQPGLVKPYSNYASSLTTSSLLASPSFGAVSAGSMQSAVHLGQHRGAAHNFNDSYHSLMSTAPMVTGDPSVGPVPGAEPSSAYAASMHAASKEMTNPSGAVQPSAVQNVDPRLQQTHGLVQPEDCDFFQVFASNPSKGAAALGGTALSRAVHRGQGGSGRNLPKVSQVYVQDAQNGSEFKAIAPGRARRAYGLGTGEVVHRGRDKSKKKDR
jgi:hypothetical protein